MKYKRLYAVINAVFHKHGNSRRGFVICKINLDNAREIVDCDYVWDGVLSQT